MPSGATAGDAFTPGRCEPQVTEGGTAVGDGGHGVCDSENALRHCALPAGVPTVIADQLTYCTESFGEMRTRNESTTSLANQSGVLFLSCTTV